MSIQSIDNLTEEIIDNPGLAQKRRDLLFAGMSFILVLLIAGAFAPIGVDWHHDGFLYKPAEDLANGKTPFRETYILHGYFTTAFHSLLLKYIAPRLIVLRYSAALFYAFAGLFFYLSWRRILPDKLALFSVLLFIGLMPFWNSCGLYAWSSVYILPFYGLILFFGGRLLDCPDDQKRGTKYAVLMAIFSLIIWQFREPAGIFNCFCLIIFWPLSALAGFLRWKQALRYGLVYSGVCLAGVLLFFVWLGYEGAVEDWYLQTKSSAIKIHVQGFGGSLGAWGMLVHIYQCLTISQPIPFAKMEPFWILFPLICGAYLLRSFLPIQDETLLRVSDDSTANSMQSVNLKPYLLLLALVGCGSCLQYYPVCCYVHCGWGAAASTGLLVYAFWSFVSKRTDALSMFILALILGFVFIKPILIDRIPTGVTRLGVAYNNLQIRYPLPIRGIRPTGAEVNLLPVFAKTMEFQQEHPEIPMTAIVQSPMLWYLLPEFVSTDASYVFDSKMETESPEQWKRLKNYIEQNKPLILIDEAILEGYSPLLSQYKVIYISDIYALTNGPLVLMMNSDFMTEKDKQDNNKPNNINMEKTLKQMIEKRQKR